METITTPLNLSQVTARFLSCGYVYQEQIKDYSLQLTQLHNLYFLTIIYNPDGVFQVREITKEKLTLIKNEFRTYKRLITNRG